MTQAILVGVILLRCLVCAISNIPPEPVPHLTPPEAVHPLADKQARWQWNNSGDQSSSGTEDITQLDTLKPVEPKTQEASSTKQRSIFWAAPAIPLYSSHRGRSTENCNPCDRVPWVPMARALGGPHFAISIPTIQLTVPVKGSHLPQPLYGIPLAQLSPSSARYGPPKELHPPSNQYGPPTVVDTPLSPHGQPIDDLNSDYGPPPLPPAPHNFPAPPPPHTYGPPRPNHEFPPNFGQQSNKQLPPPPLPSFQLLPSVQYGPPFAHKQPPDYKPLSKPPPTYLPSKHHDKSPYQYQDESIKSPIFVQNPIPFPTLSRHPLPPMFGYETFNDGKSQPQSYLQPPKPQVSQNVVFTISESNEESCKKCKDHSEAHTDSETASAQHHVTENTVKHAEEKNKQHSLEQGKYNVEVMKSVPLAEYLASVEYPMQIIQAPILDVPDLPKYFDLGYHNYNPINQHSGNTNPEDQKTAQSFIQQNKGHALFVNHGLRPMHLNSSTSLDTTSLDDVDSSSEGTSIANSIPPNHKPNLGIHGETTEKISANTVFTHSTKLYSSPTTKPSQIFHISKGRPPTTRGHTDYTSPPGPTLSPSPSLTQGHYVTEQPLSNPELAKTRLQLPSISNPPEFQELINTSSLDYQSNVNPESNNQQLSNLRFLDPPRAGSGRISDWTLHSLANGLPWSSTPPHPFVMPTTNTPRARFVVRPSPTPLKKPKQIHQIIVPYTTNKHNHPIDVNSQGWTPIPPSNQARKVPHFNFGQQLPPSGLDQYQTIFPSGVDFKTDSQLGSIPLSATGTDNLGSMSPDTPLNLPPQVINQILKLGKQSGYPQLTEENLGSADFRQFLATNLQGLLRGEEDSIDITHLQKNIDNWTAEGYKQNSPSVNFNPIATITHLVTSKKIPEEYLTSTVPSPLKNNTLQEDDLHENTESDHEVSASQNHPVKIFPQSHSKGFELNENNTNSIENVLNGWSLLDTKVTTSSEQPTTVQTTSQTEPTSKPWEKIQVSISPLTNEKVYVVTPVTISESTTQSPSTQSSTSFSTTRVERSYSMLTSARSAKVLKLPSSHDHEKTEEH